MKEKKKITKKEFFDHLDNLKTEALYKYKEEMQQRYYAAKSVANKKIVNVELKKDEELIGVITKCRYGMDISCNIGLRIGDFSFLPIDDIELIRTTEVYDEQRKMKKGILVVFKYSGNEYRTVFPIISKEKKNK